MKNVTLLLVSLFLITSCKTTQTVITKEKPIKGLRFIGEQTIAANTYVDSLLLGGLSSIDYANGHFYAISDDKNNARFYEFVLDYNLDAFNAITIIKQTKITSPIKDLDPESLRFDPETNHFIWTSEGAIRKGISPALFEITTTGDFIKQIPTPKRFQVSKDATKGPRQNGTFEGLSMAKDTKYIWLAMELPLREDGEEPSLKAGKYPVRISKINKETGEVVFQFVYELGAIPKDSKPAGKFRVNGTPEILALGNKQFFIIERAYASGYDDGGNTVKIFKINAQKASDVKNINSLKTTAYVPATKELFFDFESVRSQLTKGIVDNIEGITFGKKLANGHQSLVFVSDDNFKKFSPQLTQFIVFEVLPF